MVPLGERRGDSTVTSCSASACASVNRQTITRLSWAAADGAPAVPSKANTKSKIANRKNDVKQNPIQADHEAGSLPPGLILSIVSGLNKRSAIISSLNFFE